MPGRPSKEDSGYRPLPKLLLSDVEAIRLVLRGGSVIDWHRLNFDSEAEALELIRAQELDPDDADDQRRMEAVKHEAISYLRRHFDFPIPKPVAGLSLPALMMLAADKGHRQLCACTILKVMHIINHLQGRELLFTLPISDREVFNLVEEKVYRVIGGMMARGFPLVEFIGGRKNQDSLYTKLLSKQDTIAANIYDKMRFRIVTRSPDDIFPVINYMLRHVFPFNYVIPGQSTNTLFHFRSYCEQHPHLRGMMRSLQLSPDLEDDLNRVTNRFSANDYQVLHFVVDMPVRLTPEIAALNKASVQELGSVVFAQAEFQIIDQHTEQHNEVGEASHAAYKERQKQAVMRRLKVGIEPPRRPKRER
jgi:uncharacterized protein (TIGR04552 family)